MSCLGDHESIITAINDVQAYTAKARPTLSAGKPRQSEQLKTQRVLRIFHLVTFTRSIFNLSHLTFTRSSVVTSCALSHSFYSCETLILPPDKPVKNVYVFTFYYVFVRQSHALFVASNVYAFGHCLVCRFFHKHRLLAYILPRTA